MRFNGLKSLAYYYTTYGGYDRELDDYIDRFKPSSYLEIPENLLSKYATMDAIINYQVEEKMQKQLTELDEKFPPLQEGGWKVRDYYEKVKIPAVNAFVDIEIRGVYVDIEKWDTNANIIEQKINDIKNTLRDQLHITEVFISEASLFENEEKDDDGKKDVLQSNMKLGILLEKKGWECLGRSKTGYYLTGDEQLTRWEQLGRTEATLIKSLRSYLTLQKTFMGKSKDYNMGWRRYIETHPDGSHRIHPVYKPLLMDTQRNGCSNPNYQQGPSGSKDAKLFKEVYSTPNNDDYYLCNLDYSGFQVRLAAIDIGNDKDTLFQAYKENPFLDLHCKTGWNIFCKGTKFDVEEIEIIDGDKKRVFFPHEEVSVMRNGQKIKVQASMLEETDILC
jgi:DNA polymerase I-like protein with 3'-5' exonuclease and polymerase domains